MGRPANLTVAFDWNFRVLSPNLHSLACDITYTHVFILKELYRVVYVLELLRHLLSDWSQQVN